MTTTTKEVTPISSLYEALDTLAGINSAKFLCAELCQKIGETDVWEIRHWFDHQEGGQSVRHYPITAAVANDLFDGNYVEEKHPKLNHEPFPLFHLNDCGVMEFKNRQFAKDVLQANEFLSGTEGILDDFISDVLARFNTLVLKAWLTRSGFRISMGVKTRKDIPYIVYPKADQSTGIHETKSEAIAFAQEILSAIRMKGCELNLDLPEGTVEEDLHFDPQTFDDKVVEIVALLQNQRPEAT